jgi:asparagine synthase (glutamine-hydrolysing)
MLFFVAIAWNPRCAEAAEIARTRFQRFHELAPRWKPAVACDGLLLTCIVPANSRALQVYRLADGHGLILGKLFKTKRPLDPVSTTFGTTESRQIAECKGEPLLLDYWGQYVAFVCDPRTNTRCIIRDPSGALPCYMIQDGELTIFFSRVGDGRRLISRRLTIDRRYVVGRLAYTAIASRRTGFREISSVLAGERVTLNNTSVSRDFPWNPLTLARANLIEDFSDAVRTTRSTVHDCVHAWSSCFDGILHSLSGGLDSSIVLACMSSAPSRPRIICENIFGLGSNEDERRYARLVASMVGAELLETEGAHDIPFALSESALNTCEPHFVIETTEARLRMAKIIQKYGLSAKFTGTGGDELFFTRGPLPTCADYMYLHGIGALTARIALEDSLVDGASIWRVLRGSVRYGLLKCPWNIRKVYDRRATPLLCADVFAEARNDDELMHPLFTEPARLPPGKLFQAALLSLQANRRYHPTDTNHPSFLPVILPLSSQPLMELSLRVPLYVLRAGARDRAVARAAFSADIPEQIALRRTKSSGDQSLKELIYSAIEPTRKLLLDGMLVSQGLLEPKALALALHPDVPSRMRIAVIRLFDYAALEMWYRHWA